jgi:hypothetical protein
MRLERSLRAAGEARRMESRQLIDTKSLLEEIARYLAAVDLFRALGSEPTWLPEATFARK